jgi:hypothetical protein
MLGKPVLNGGGRDARPHHLLVKDTVNPDNT